MDFLFIKQVIPLFCQAAFLTLQIVAAGVILSFAAGLFCAFVRYYKIPVLRKIVHFYVELSRNTPLLIQLFFLYFALPNLGIKLSALECCVIGRKISFMPTTKRLFAMCTEKKATRIQSSLKAAFCKTRRF